jgi:hypothetical protein
MAKTKRYTNFREFYEDETRPKKMKPVNESKKTKDKFRKQFNNVDPNELDEEDFDEIDDYLK